MKIAEVAGDDPLLPQRISGFEADAAEDCPPLLVFELVGVSLLVAALPCFAELCQRSELGRVDILPIRTRGDCG